ncbi:MAG: DUF4202 domain-containing protein [Actinobacteria bacterium]|nr:DUF4202 domain-containing protein [Actinomycetota bacterium]
MPADPAAASRDTARFDTARFAAAVAAIDAANAQDPASVVVEGEPVPLALAQGREAAAWVERLDPTATEAQLLAARAHHLRRWEVPRSSYPEGRAGYLRWRADQKRRHATEVATILVTAGYGEDEVERVGAILRKEQLGRDPAVQVHEDAVCLVFLAWQLDETAERLGAEHIVEVLRRTARKMSPAGLAAAATLPLSTGGAELLARALALS